MAHSHADLVARFYDALSRRDGDAMAACYLPAVTLRDPVFDLPGLKHLYHIFHISH